MFNFLKRKTRNRRLNSGTVLEVKLRSDQVRSTRMRTLAIGFGVTFCTFFCFFLLWCIGNWGLRRLVYENPAFAITEVDARTDGVIVPDQIRRWAAVKTGENLMALDLVRVKRDLELVPLVQSVSVERVLPHTLRIRVTEREPVAQVNLPRARQGGGLDVAVVHLDVEGYVMPPLDPRLRSTPLGQLEELLPVVTGVNPMELQPGKRIESAQVQSALELVQKFQESSMATVVELKRVDVTSPEVLIATTSQGSEITFGTQEIDQQLLRWRDIYEQGRRYNQAIVALDLAVTNNTPVRLTAASLQQNPPPTRKPAKPSRISSTTRKRNV